MMGSLGGGTLTMIPVLPGRPASGQPFTEDNAVSIENMIEQIKLNNNINEVIKEKMIKVLELKKLKIKKQNKLNLSTEIIEEFISICDGQVKYLI